MKLQLKTFCDDVRTDPAVRFAAWCAGGLVVAAAFWIAWAVMS